MTLGDASVHTGIPCIANADSNARPHALFVGRTMLIIARASSSVAVRRSRRARRPRGRSTESTGGRGEGAPHGAVGRRLGRFRPRRPRGRPPRVEARLVDAACSSACYGASCASVAFHLDATSKAPPTPRATARSRTWAAAAPAGAMAAAPRAASPRPLLQVGVYLEPVVHEAPTPSSKINDHFMNLYSRWSTNLSTLRKCFRLRCCFRADRREALLS